MKSSKTLVALLVAPLFAVALAFAADAKKDAPPAPEAKAAACCVTATKDGKACPHPCCVEAAKKGLNCTDCGGSGAVAKPAQKK